MAADAISVVEAGYASELSDEDWVASVCHRSWEAFGIGTACFAYLYDASSGRLSIRCPSVSRSSGERRLDVLRAVGMSAEAIPEPVLAALYDPSPPVGFASEYIGPGPTWEILRQTMGDDSVDVIGMRAGGPDRRGLLVAFPLTESCGLAWQTRQTLNRVAAHLAAAHRLRLAGADTHAPDDAAAVLTPDARIEHLGDDGEVRKRRGALVDAVRRMEKSRGPARRLDPAASLAKWRALVEGRWSVVDFVDRDGKRLILARRNELQGRDLLAITDPERQVLELASLGHTNKQIAYELGIAPPTVTAQLRRGLARLGLRSRAELIAMRAQPVVEKT